MSNEFEYSLPANEFIGSRAIYSLGSNDLRSSSFRVYFYCCQDRAIGRGWTVRFVGSADGSGIKNWIFNIFFKLYF